MRNSIAVLFLFIFSINSYSVEVLSFSKAYNLSLKSSKKIKALELKLKSNYQNIKQAQSKLYPDINFYSTYSKNDYKFENRSTKKISQKLRNYNVVLQQAIFDKNISSKIDIERSKFKSFQTEVEIAKQDLIRDVLEVYLTLIKSKNKLRMLISYKKLLKSKKSLLDERYKMDLSTLTEILNVESQLNQAIIDLEKEKLLFKLNKNKLQTFIGKDIKFIIPRLDKLKLHPSVIKQLQNELSNFTKIQSNLEIKKLKNILQVYKNELSDAKNNHLPKLNLSMKYTKNINVQNTSTFSSTYDEDREILLRLSIPLYKGGSLRALELASKLNIKSSQKELENLKNELNLQYEEIITNIKWSIKYIKLYEKALVTATISRDIIKKEYKYGIKSIIDLNEANYKIFEIREKSIDNITSLINNYLSFLRITNNHNKLSIIDSLIKR